MKILKMMMVGMVLILTACSTHAQSLSDILGNVTKNSSNSSSSGNILTSLLDGIFTKTNLSLADLVGEYQAQGAAVTFKSENFLQKAGGIAGAAAIESKINPYYEKYGLNNMVLTVDNDANFTMKIKAITLKGTISKNDNEGTFDFNFNVAGIKLGKFTAYVEKSGKNLNLMFDATKLKSFVSTVAKFTGNTMASTLGTILDSYDGACIGWKMVCISSPNSNSITTDSNSKSDSNSNSNEGSSLSKGINALKDILK